MHVLQMSGQSVSRDRVVEGLTERRLTVHPLCLMHLGSYNPRLAPYCHGPDWFGITWTNISCFLVWLAPSKLLFPVGLVRHIKQRIETALLLDMCVISGNKLASGISAAIPQLMCDPSFHQFSFGVHIQTLPVECSYLRAYQVTLSYDLGPIFDEEEEQFDNPTQDSLLVTRRPLSYDLGPIFDEEARPETIEQSDPKETKEAAKEELFRIQPEPILMIFSKFSLFTT
ncbi:hypothetical protein DY000_02040846 [Brassica cretica]|uniref:Uncharacterized protein n=1 Tax=Brassica cretica TaxID=69181 RepID=A0ABQ7BII0_BRACR|nr:hypothetical protein DY000_02040846 [Brassica cretica]